MNNYNNNQYKAKRLDNEEWVEGILLETTPCYCFKEDYDKCIRTFVIINVGFADWGMPRPIKVYPIDINTIQTINNQKYF